jgi:prepilin-type N-terminal cleavage/methylation domain-containing protein
MLTKLNRKRDAKGFTLIELMIVIAIIGILAAIAIPQFAAYRVRAYNSAANADLRNLCTAQEAYFVDEYVYAANAQLGLLISDYGATTSKGVTMTINNASTTFYNMQANHADGDATYTIRGPGGAVEKQ